jgi:S1-C subfamily serine protease
MTDQDPYYSPGERQEEPTLVSDPTSQVPRTPPPPGQGAGYGPSHYGQPSSWWGHQYPWQPGHPQPSAYQSPGAGGAYPPGGGLGSPPGSVPPGAGIPPGAPLWHWPVPPPAQHPRTGWSVLLTIVVAAVALTAVLSVLITHSLWKAASSSSNTPSLNPFGGSASNPFGGTSPGGSSSGSGGPSNAAAIAKNVDPALVDVNTSVNYGEAEGAGTGMVLTPTGEVLTNNHVVEGATTISVTDVGNGKTYNATVVGYDRSHDVAVLQLSNSSGQPVSGLRTVTTGDSSKATVGQAVVAIGNANGAGGTPSYAGGSVTATDQSITASDELSSSTEQLSGLIETNADIISGDSGGPLVNSSGQVIGIDTASSSGGGFQFQSPSNQGFAIPINQALSTARSVEAGASSSTIHVGQTAFLGVEVAPGSTCSGVGGFGGFGGGFGGGNGSASGALVCGVVPGGPADQAGIKGGDTITSVDGHSIGSASTLTDVMVADEKADTSITVEYTDTSGQHQSTTVRLSSGPPQ